MLSVTFTILLTVGTAIAIPSATATTIMAIMITNDVFAATVALFTAFAVLSSICTSKSFKITRNA